MANNSFTIIPFPLKGVKVNNRDGAVVSVTEVVTMLKWSPL